MYHVEITNIYKTDNTKNKIIATFKIFITILLCSYFFLAPNMYMANGDFFIKRTFFAIFVFGLLIFLCFVDFKLPKKLDRYISILLTLMSPISVLIISEMIINEAKCAVPATPIVQKEPLWLGISLAVILLLHGILLFLSNSMRVAGCMSHIIIIVLSIVICIVYDFRGIPLMAPDILTVKTATSVMGNYTIVLSFRQYISILFCVMLLYVFLKLDEVKVSKKVWVRVVAFLFVICCTTVFTEKVIFSDYMEKKGINIRMFRPMESYQKYGAIATFTRSIGYLKVQKPEEYSLRRVKKITRRYDETDKNQKEDLKKANVIVIVNETFADLKVLGDFSTNKDYMPFYHAMKKNTIKGYTYASIVGGQTANTEFELLTSNTLGFLPAGTTIFQLYIHDYMPSLVSNLKRNGYGGNKALHPFNPENYNRPAVYNYLGFSDFLDKKDFPEDVTKVRSYISDEAVVDKIIEEYETYRKNSDKPYFSYNLTVQNHSPYDKDFSNFNQTIRIEDNKYDDQANRFLNLIKYSDDSLKKLVKYLEKKDDPTVVLFLGDHQPRLTGNFLWKVTNGKYSKWNSEEMMKRYQVPFVIWANYDIEEKYVQKTSMNYLQNMVSETAGIRMSGYQKFLEDVRKKIPVITSQGYWGKNGKFYQLEDKNSPYYDIIQEYRIIQYNMMFDVKNREDSFFSVKK